MSQSIALSARLPQPAGTNITAPQWRVLCEAIFPGAQTSGAIQLALDYCAARKLDPFKRPVHIVPMWSKLLKKNVETVWPGINELQVTASRTGQWAGMDDPRWGSVTKRTFTSANDNGEVRNITVEFPEWCAVTVYRMIGGERHGFSEPVYWLETYARLGRTELPNEMWQKRTRGQLHKCAKAASLRAAFPEEVGNDYAAEEMEGKDIEAGGVTINGSSVTMAEPIEQEPPMEAEAAPAPTLTDWLKALDVDLANAATKEAVDAILARPDVQKMQDDHSRPKARDRVQAMLDAAIKRTAEDPPEMDGEAEQVENASENEAA